MALTRDYDWHMEPSLTMSTESSFLSAGVNFSADVRIDDSAMQLDSYFAEAFYSLGDLLKYDAILNSSSITPCDFPPDPLPGPVLTIFTVVYIVIIVFALLGNLLVILVIGLDRKMRTVTNVLLVSLAGSDALIAGINMPIRLRFLLQNEWTMGEAMCKISNYIQGVVVVTSIFTLTGIAIDRYYAICRPLQARHLHTICRTVLLIVCFWLTAIVLLIPQLLVQRLEPFLLIDDDRLSFRVVYLCTEYFFDFWLDVAYTIFFYVALYLLPVIIIFTAYGRIGMTLWYRSPLAESSSGSHADTSRRVAEKKRIVNMLVVIVTVFTVSWFPFFTAQVYLLFDGGECHRRFDLRVAVAVFQLFAYSSCCINPIIYCLLNDSFRQRLRRALTILFPKRRLRRITWSGRRPTLTETMRTTAGLFSSSNRRGSYPNGVLSRPVSYHRQVRMEENGGHVDEAAAPRHSTAALAKDCYGNGGIHCNGSLLSPSTASEREPLKDMAAVELQKNRSGSLERLKDWLVVEEAFEDQPTFNVTKTLASEETSHSSLVFPDFNRSYLYDYILNETSKTTQTKNTTENLPFLENEAPGVLTHLVRDDSSSSSRSGAVDSPDLTPSPVLLAENFSDPVSFDAVYEESEKKSNDSNGPIRETSIFVDEFAMESERISADVGSPGAGLQDSDEVRCHREVSEDIQMEFRDLELLLKQLLTEVASSK